MRTSYDTLKRRPDTNHAFLSKLLDSHRQLATAKGPKPYADILKAEMARLTLARKIAAIALTLWKKEERFDAEQLKTQAA